MLPQPPERKCVKIHVNLPPTRQGDDDHVQDFLKAIIGNVDAELRKRLGIEPLMMLKARGARES